MAEDGTELSAGEEEGKVRPDRAESALSVYGSGVRTALRNNATAYGFSITITSSYGLVNGAGGPPSSWETVSFALGAAVAFVLVGGVFLGHFRRGSLPESARVATMSGAVDLLSVSASVAVAYGLSRIGGYWAWPLTAAGTVVTYLLVGGVDILIARSAANRTSLAQRQ
ncbi:hypothetical protein [Actinopolyspora saharensis]|uniref:Uncharacterized protein n=1 Tax=Actinopolyspora saharensis TaxID=995062 RepID=A0A1H1AHA2_9ACTN|nr:hypothetical protein [Actinopolyspora saharensis]SDQ38911.1 hypothetical protein SAMN04489718_1576 [Actinopolyspora saharensis]